MKNNDLSSEKIAKALKGAGLSVQDRILTATEAWSNNQLFFPNKDDFLFEWLCTALIKTKVKSSTECAAFQIAYWRLFHQLLAHYHQRAHTTQKPPPAIRVQLIAVITALLGHLNTTNHDDDAKDILLELYACVDLLLSPTFSLSYRPTFEQMSTTIDQLMDTLMRVINNNKQSTAMLGPLLKVAHVLLIRYSTQLTQTANQRKSFTTIVEKILAKFLCVRRRILLVPFHELAQTISNQVTDIIVKALFHPDVVMEYTSVLKKDTSSTQQQSSSKNKNSYVAKLFEELSRLLENKKDQACILDALDVLDILLSHFVQAFRKKRGNTSSQDIDRQVEFGFFTECRTLLEKVDPSTSYVQTLSKLLQALVQWNVYVTRNDELSQQQYSILDDIAETMVSLIQDPKKSSYQGSILELARIILKVDFSLIEGRVSILWPYMLNPTKEAEEECFNLAMAVLQTYAASRQMDAYVDDLMTGLEGLAYDDVYVILEKPLFSRQFMDDLSAIVNKHMPAQQALNLFERFSRGIQESTENNINTSVSKKQKHHTQHTTPHYPRTTRFIAVFLSQFINAVRLTHHQRQAFQAPAQLLFDTFIKPSFEGHQDDTESNVIPALQIHSSLMNTMSDIYWHPMDQDTREWLSHTLESMFLIHTTAKSQSDRVAVILSANALLQHAYYAYVIGTQGHPLSSPLVSRVNSVLDFVMHETSSTDYNATWNGTLLHLDDSSVKIALWKLLADEWFDVICQFAMGERGKKLTSFVLLALLESASTTTSTTVGLSLRSTSELLLRSANFYEALCFKEHALNIILDSFNSFFKTNADKNLVTCYANFEDFGKSANDLVTVMTSSKKIRVKTEILVKAMHYLNQLLLFPLEYYTKNERQKVIWMTFIVDTLAGIATEADDEVRTKAQLRTRTLLLRFFAISNSGNILEMNADLLGWFLTTTSFRPEQENELSKAVMGRTKQLDIQVLRSLISMVISNATKAKEILDHTCKMRLEWVKNNQPNALDWVIDMVETIKESLHRHSSKEEVVNNISAQESITELSRFAIQALNDAKTRISTTLENEKEDETSSITPIDSSLLILVLLLQEYAQYLGSRGDQVVDIGALSRVMVALASPCTILLQRSLRSSSVSDRTSIMKMTTAFVSALCKILSRYQHVYVTERVFAVIWFIYSLVYESDELCAHNLCHAFFSWIGDLDSEQFAVVTQGFIEQSNRLITQATEKDRKVYLSLLSEMLRGATDEQKLWLRRYLPTFITKLSTMSRQAETVGFIQQAIQFLTTITAQQSLRTSAYDISLILACLIQVANPPEIERFGQVSKETAHILFHSICDVLQNLLLYHRQQLIDIMAPFIATLQALFYCFRSPHLALVTKKRKVDETTTGQKKFALISTWAPLDVSAADRCARIFSSMTKKSSIGGGGKSSSTTVNGKRYTGLQQYRIISRHAPFVLIEYFTIQSNVTMSISQPQVKTILETGLYNLMDMTSENDRNMVLAGLDASGKLLFKNFYTSWKENHMYTGQ